MKKILILLCSLVTIFGVSWGVKARTPINRPSNLEEETETPWYESRYTSPKASEEWTLDPEIPLNYIPVPGEDELYMVVDDAGNITGYRKRVKQADGSWMWEDTNPDIPDNYEKVEGLDGVYKVTNSDGTVSYYQYVRNKDDTFAFVPVDSKGNPLDDGKSAKKVSDKYVHVSDNVYAAYNDDNVKIGYRERVKNSDGDYIWKVCAPPASESSGNLSAILGGGGNNTASTGGITSQGSSNGTKVTNSDGTYTMTETTTSTETKGGYIITYTTTIKKTYKSDGTLLSTKKDGPYETSKTATGGGSTTADKSRIAKTLDGEVSRVSGSVTFDTNKANEVFAKLNAQRKSSGVPTLSMNKSSQAYKLALIKAADMAIYDYSSGESPMYGSLDATISRFGCSSSHPSQNIWKAGTKSASDIHTRFQANENSRKVRMSNGYSEVGIAIVEKNGNTYVAEVYLK